MTLAPRRRRAPVRSITPENEAQLAAELAADTEMLQAVGRRDVAAFQAFYRKFNGLLYATIYRVLNRANGNVASSAASPCVREPSPLPTPARPPLRILIAEDNEFNAQLLEQLLVRRGPSWGSSRRWLRNSCGE